MCGLCLGFFSKYYFFRHKKVCKENTDVSKQKNGLPIVMLDTSNKDNLSDDFKNNVLQSIRDGEVKDLIMNDRYLLIIGNRLYNKIKRRKGKEMDAIKVIRADLRRIANLYRIFLGHRPQRHTGKQGPRTQEDPRRTQNPRRTQDRGPRTRGGPRTPRRTQDPRRTQVM